MNFKLLRKDPPIAQLVCVAMLAWALVPANPYAYYVLLRFVVCGAFVYLAAKANKLHKVGWAWTFGISAVVYNPFLPAHLSRDIWSAVNVASIILVAVSVWVLRIENGDSLLD
jgi:hypothetical protein